MANAIPYIAAAVSFVGALSKGYSRATELETQSRQMTYQAQQERVNAQMELAQGNQNEEAARRKAAVQMGEQRASAAASGTGLTTGSNFDLLSQNAANYELDALSIRYGAELQARGSLAQADMDEFSAKAFKSQAKNARYGAWLSGASSILNSASSYGGKK